VWDALENLYRSKSTARRQQLRRSLAGLKKGPEESLTAYIARACGIRDALRATGHDVEEDTVVGAVLAGLPEAYDMTIEILEASEEGMELDAVVAKLLLTEQRHERKTGTSESVTALIAQGNRQKKTSFQKVAGQGQHGPRKTIECWYCGKKGHTQAQCRKRLRDEESSVATASTYAQMACAGLATKTDKSDKWLLDSGATSHMTWNAAIMQRYQAIPETTVSACDGSPVIAVGIGEVTLSATVNGRTHFVTFREVLHVPTLVCNLFS
jgi:hypothetical protein